MVHGKQFMIVKIFLFVMIRYQILTLDYDQKYLQLWMFKNGNTLRHPIPESTFPTADQNGMRRHKDKGNNR